MNGQKFHYAPRWLGLAAAAAALAIDQAHKYWMLKVFDIGERQPIRLTPFLDVMLSWNHGVSYSLFSVHDDMARGLLLGAQLAIVGGLFVWLWRSRARIVALGLGLIIGGALGNVTDRWLRGAVADFFFLHTSLPVGPLGQLRIQSRRRGDHCWRGVVVARKPDRSRAAVRRAGALKPAAPTRKARAFALIGAGLPLKGQEIESSWKLCEASPRPVENVGPLIARSLVQ